MQINSANRLSRLIQKFRDKVYRDSYVATHTRGILARQIRNFRGTLSQAEFGAKIGKRQTVVSRLESAGYGGWSLRTMFEIARKLNVAVFVRFVDFPTFLRYSNDLSDAALHPNPYNSDAFSDENCSRLVPDWREIAEAEIERARKAPDP